MKRILVVACFAIMLAGVGSSCAQPRAFVGGGVAFGRPVPPGYFYGSRPAVIIPPRVFITPRPNAFAPRQWGAYGRGRGWRRGC
jgi:hypothetical protein